MVPMESWRNSTPDFGAAAFCTTKKGDFRTSSTTGIYSTRIRLQEGEEKIQAEEKNERLNDDNSFASEELENIIS